MDPGERDRFRRRHDGNNGRYYDAATGRFLSGDPTAGNAAKDGSHGTERGWVPRDLFIDVRVRFLPLGNKES